MHVDLSCVYVVYPLHEKFCVAVIPGRLCFNYLRSEALSHLGVGDSVALFMKEMISEVLRRRLLIFC